MPGQPELTTPALRRARSSSAVRRVAWAVGSALLLGALALGVWLFWDAPRSAGGSASTEPVARSFFLRVQQLLGVAAPAPESSDTAASRASASDRSSLETRPVTALPGPGGTAAGVGSAGSGAAGSAGSGAVGAAAAASSGPSTPAGTPEAPTGEAASLDASLSGRVIDATGGPVAGARVRVHFIELAFARFRTTGKFAPPNTPDAEWSTDAQGAFQGMVPAGRVALEASAEAYTESRKTAQAPASGVVLVLAPGATITGRVQRSDGTPVEGANVQAKPRGILRPPLETVSDAQGGFTIASVPSGVVEISASAPALSSAREWLRLGLAEVSEPVVLTLAPAHSVHGVVRVADGSPCTAGMVHVAGRLGQMASVDERGGYRIDGLDAGAHRLSASCAGLAARTQAIEIGPGSPASIELNWELGKGFVLAGSVQHRSGQPAPGVMVWVIAVPPPAGAPQPAEPASAQSPATCYTDAAGEFECSGLPGGWYRANAIGGAESGPESAPVRVDAESNERVTLILPDAGEVRVRVAGGASFGGQFAQGVFARGQGPIPIPAQPRGADYVFENLPLGRYRVGVGRAPSEKGPSAADVELTQPGQIIEIELQAPELLAIRGIVVDAEGAPVPDAWVQASLSERGFPMLLGMAEPALTGTDGVFEIGELAPGRYALGARHSSGETVLRDVSAGQRDVRIVIKDFGSLSGVVRAPDGALAGDFAVLLSREPAGEPLHVDGERGTWSMPWVAPGEYRVIVMSSQGGAVSNATVTTGSKTELSLRLDAALAGNAIMEVLERPR